MKLRFLHEDGTPCTAKECLAKLAKIGETHGGYGWQSKVELLACAIMIDSSEEECEQALTEMETISTSRLEEWRQTQ